MKSGIYPNVNFKDYLAIKAVSNSYLGRLDKCPAAALVKQEDTPSLILGRAVHKLVLEGIEAFSSEFANAPTCDRRTKEGKAIWAETLLRNEGKHLLSADDWLKVYAIYKAVKAHPRATEVLAENVTEQTCVWTDKETGLLCKIRPDSVPDAGKMALVDLKTCADASEDGFTRSIVKYGYARQAALYLDGYNAVTRSNADAFIFMAVEPDEPYRTEVYLLDNEFIKYGREKYRWLLEKEKRCRAEKSYPHYSTPNIVQLYKPAYL